MDNIIEFANKGKQNSTKNDDSDPVHSFIKDHLLPWAMDNGIDVNSMKFKLNGATIMTCIQGMLLDDI